MSSHSNPQPPLPRSLSILVAPSGFKESLHPGEAADCIETGIFRVYPNARIHKIPLYDGGEGFARALTLHTGGTIHEVTICGPYNKDIPSHYGILGRDNRGNDDVNIETAVLDISSVCGLRLVPLHLRNPGFTTSFGVGELIRAAVENGAQRVIVGCGDSGTNDGGVGMCQALGIHFRTMSGTELERGGIHLAKLERIDMSSLIAQIRFGNVKIEGVCNYQNLLESCTIVYAPQKGASPKVVDELDKAMRRYADILSEDCSIAAARAPGSGSSGGIGAGLRLLGASIKPRWDAMTNFFGLDRLFMSEEAERQYDLVITAEGSIDYQTPRGKINSEIAKRAKEKGVPVIGLAGKLGQGVEDNVDVGIVAYESIMKEAMGIKDAMGDTERLLVDGAERAMRMLSVGMGVGGKLERERRKDSGASGENTD